MLKHIYYRLADVVRSVQGMRRLKEMNFTMLLGHAKVIGREQGLPVRSLFIPADLSQPLIRSQARFFNNLRSAQPVAPLISTLGVTARCKLKCSHCSAAGLQGQELETAAWQDVIRQSQDLGVFTVVVTGGEPLERDDLTELIRTVDKERSVVLMFTSGYGLAERAGELKAAGLNRIMVSLDHPEAEQHDSNRGRAGLYQEALAGLTACRKLNMLIGLSTFTTPQRLSDGIVAGIIELGCRLQVNEVAVFDGMPVGRFQEHHSVPAAFDSDYYTRLRAEIADKQKQYKRLGIWSYQQMRQDEAIGCSAGASTFKIAHNGEMQPCDFCKDSVGNVQDATVASLFQQLRAGAQACREQGCSCRVLAQQTGESNE